MFDKKVTFCLVGPWYVSRVLEILSIYRHGIKEETDLRILSCHYDIGTNVPTFTIRIRCREDELTKCLSDIMKLGQNGAQITKLSVR